MQLVEYEKISTNSFPTTRLLTDYCPYTIGLPIAHAIGSLIGPMIDLRIAHLIDVLSCPHVRQTLIRNEMINEGICS